MPESLSTLDLRGWWQKGERAQLGWMEDTDTSARLPGHKQPGLPHLPCLDSEEENQKQLSVPPTPKGGLTHVFALCPVIYVSRWQPPNPIRTHHQQICILFTMCRAGVGSHMSHHREKCARQHPSRLFLGMLFTRHFPALTC